MTRTPFARSTASNDRLNLVSQLPGDRRPMVGLDPIAGRPRSRHPRPRRVDRPRAAGHTARRGDPAFRAGAARRNAVSGHHVEASDGEIGHVEDFLVDDRTWAIRYLIVDTRDWLPGKKVLISPKWIKRVSWSEKQGKRR